MDKGELMDDKYRDMEDILKTIRRDQSKPMGELIELGLEQKVMMIVVKVLDGIDRGIKSRQPYKSKTRKVIEGSLKFIRALVYIAAGIYARKL